MINVCTMLSTPSIHTLAHSRSRCIAAAGCRPKLCRIKTKASRSGRPMQPSLHSNRAAVGQELLGILSQPGASVSDQIDGVCNLVATVQQSMKTSQDWMQLKMVMNMAAQQFNSLKDSNLSRHNSQTTSVRGSHVQETASLNKRHSQRNPLDIQPSQPAGTVCPTTYDISKMTAGSSSASPPSGVAPQQPDAFPWNWDCVTQLVVLGLGSLGAYQGRADAVAAGATRASARVHQLALALLLPALLPGLQHPTIFVDPEYSEWDEQLIGRLGGSVIPLLPPPQPFPGPSPGPQHLLPPSMPQPNTGSASSHPCQPPCLMVYAPCCPRALYSQILATNLAAGTLRNVAVLGNSFRAQGDSSALFKALVSEEDAAVPQLLADFCAAKAFVEAPCPDFAAHGVAVGLHLFPQAALSRLGSKT